MKECTNCGEEKEDSEFYTRLKNKDGLSYWCKECIRKQNKKRYHEKKKEGSKKKKKKKVPKRKYIKRELEKHNKYYFAQPRGCRCNGITSFCVPCYIKSRKVIKHIKKNNDDFWDERRVRSVPLNVWKKKVKRGDTVIEF